MPIHDWTLVDAGTFHAFHTSWITHIMEALNAGDHCTAPSSGTGRRMQTDVLTLRAPQPQQSSATASEGDRQTIPQACLRLHPDPAFRKPRVPGSGHLVGNASAQSGHQVVALIEIVSPSNKDRKSHVRDMAEKVVRSLESGVHVLLLDLLPSGVHDPGGIHKAVWSYFDTTAYEVPADDPLTLASYRWDGSEPEAFVEPVAVGKPLIDMPLFLTAERYVNVPLEPTYRSAYAGMPEFWRDILEGKVPPNSDTANE